MKTLQTIITTVVIFLCITTVLFAQKKPTLAVMNIDVSGVKLDPKTLGNMVRLEIDKTGMFTVLDKYDMSDLLAASDLNDSKCYGKNCLVAAGKVLNVDKMVSGSAERFGDKIVITLRLIDVNTASIDSTEIIEYLNLQDEFQSMIQISVNSLLGIPTDPHLYNILVFYERPISSPQTRLNLNGPRMGAAYVTGDIGRRLQAPRSEGGYDILPVVSQFGYQFEVQYLSAGNFQALVEGLFVVTGLEQQLFIPSFTFMNGFRGNKSGLEITFGPIFSARKIARGFIDKDAHFSDDSAETGHWYLKKDYYSLAQEYGYTDDDGIPLKNPYEILEKIDHRGGLTLVTGWVWALGKTFQSGYLNIPINVFIVPRKEGAFIGASVGFNLKKSRTIK
ncbi:MAG: hypothetical protein IIA45_08355 [Bacteroidetes bacterium]|nr:hypothetical protein [Bacteroidota bacterium]